MRANVYVLTEFRPDPDGEGAKWDVWMVGGTQQELLDYYAELKGRAITDVETVTRDGHENLILDRDSHGGSAIIAQYKVGLSEFLDDDA